MIFSPSGCRHLAASISITAQYVLLLAREVSRIVFIVAQTFFG
jgi:hypothetical protein